MTFKRFVAATSREALVQVRRELGDGAVILSNKKIGNGRIEILAAGERTVEALVEQAERRRIEDAPAARRKPPQVETFQDYLRRQGADLNARPAAAEGAPVRAASGPRQAAATVDAGPAASMYQAVAEAPDDEAPAAWADSRWAATVPLTTPDPMAPHWDMPASPQPVTQRAAMPVARAPAAPAAVEPAVFRRRPSRLQAAPQPAVAHAATDVPASAAAPAARPAGQPPAQAAPPPQTELRLPPPSAQPDERLLRELASLRSALQEQLASISNTVAASDATRRSPGQTRLMTRLLTAGFSVEVARRIVLHAPESAQPDEADEWLQEVLSINVRCADDGDSIVERGGRLGNQVYALVGPTGVGKTTTVAKLAARYAVKYGTASLGLITLDGYRIGAHEQLRSYGRILGVPVALAQDCAALRDLLASMQSKKLVLIDTCGLGPRDARLNEMLDMLAQAGAAERPVQPVLLLNAASHAETLDESARAWRAGRATGAIFTKIDEAARVGGALDCVLRHKLRVLGLTNGQRVPEDWHLAQARLLAHLALKPASRMFALSGPEAAALAQQGQGMPHSAATAGAPRAGTLETARRAEAEHFAAPTRQSAAHTSGRAHAG